MTRVLYAEDDPQIAELVRFFFQRYDDFELSVVESGRGCLASMAASKYDLLLLDLMMPDLDGLNVLGELTARRDPTPVIMVSGHGQHQLAVRALRAGAVDCVDKNTPDFRRLPDLVRQTLARQRRTAPVAPVAPGAAHQVLFIDSDVETRTKTSDFFRASAPRLELHAAGPDALEPVLAGKLKFDAVVLGPSLLPNAMLDAVRHLRGLADEVPVAVVSGDQTGETAIAAFKLGASDYLLQNRDWLTELVFSLNNALKRRDADRLNRRLSDELATLNQSLAAQVAARTSELQQEVVVRREAEKRAAEQAIRSQALATRILRVQEDERYALAQELHDQIGQLLTGQRFQIEAARARGPMPELDEAIAVTDELLSSVRALTLQLRPRVLDDLGLQPALEWHSKNFRRQTGIAVELEVSLPAERLPRTLETAVYRVVQEALTNIARHSGAMAAVVTVTADETSLQLEIADRGRGFDADAALARNDSLGLAGLIERVGLAGGRFELFSRPGQGTRIHAEFPLVAEAALIPS